MAASISAEALHLLPWIDLPLDTAVELWLDGEVGAPSEEGGQRQSGCELFPKPASEAGTVCRFLLALVGVPAEGGYQSIPPALGLNLGRTAY